MQWKEFNGYEVSEYGDVKKNGKKINSYISSGGYVCIRLYIYDDVENNGVLGFNYKIGESIDNLNNKKGKIFRLHRLVYQLFIGEIPSMHDIHHINEDKENNHYSNLKCISHNDHVSIHKNKGKNSINSKIYLRNYYRLTIMKKCNDKNFYYNENREMNNDKIKMYQKEYREKNKDKIKMYQKEYRLKKLVISD